MLPCLQRSHPATYRANEKEVGEFEAAYLHCIPIKVTFSNRHGQDTLTDAVKIVTIRTTPILIRPTLSGNIGFLWSSILDHPFLARYPTRLVTGSAQNG